MIARGTGYVRGNRQVAGSRLAAHFKYLEHRALGEGETRESRTIFSKEADTIGRQAALSDVMDHTSTSVNYHKLVLSPGSDEPVDDLKDWTRRVMHDLEHAQGKALHWYAVEHHNTEHPHVHVVVAGAGEHVETGRTQAVKLYARDYDGLRASGREQSDYAFYREVEHISKELDMQDRAAFSRERGHRDDDHFHHQDQGAMER